MSADYWTLPLATEAFLTAFATLAEDEDDDRVIPVGRLLDELAHELGIERDIDVEWECTAGELRARTREAYVRLAKGDLP